MKDKLLGVYTGQVDRIRPELLGVDKMKVGNWNDLKHQTVSIEVRADKMCGARAELFFNKSFTEMMLSHVSKKDRQKIAKAIKEDDGKPVDVSKWVKPDEQSIKNRLISDLLLAEILLPEYGQDHGAKASVLFGVLYSKSPTNPQYIVNFSIHPYFETIFNVCKKKKLLKERTAISLIQSGKKKSKSRDLAEAQKLYAQWKTNCLKRMVVIKTPLKKKHD